MKYAVRGGIKQNECLRKSYEIESVLFLNGNSTVDLMIE